VAKAHDTHMTKQYEGSKALFTDRVVHVWDTSAGDKLRWLLTGHQDRVSAVAFSPDSRLLLTGSWDGTARLWDLATSKTTAELTRHRNSLAAVLFTPDGRGVLTVSHGFRWTSTWPSDFKPDVRDPLEYRDPAPSTGTVSWVTFQGPRPEGVFARLWDVPAGKERVEFVWPDRPRVYDFRPTSAAFSGDGRQVAFGFEVGGQGAGLWDAATGLPIRLFPIDWSVRQVHLSEDGSRLLTASPTQWQVWDTKDGKRLGGQKNARGWSWLALRPDGEQVAAGDGALVRLWNSGTGEEVLVLHAHQAAVHYLAYSKDGRRLVTTGDTSARLWNVAPETTLLPLLRIPGARVLDAAWSPDGKRVTAGTTRKDALLWEPATGAQTVLRPERKRGEVLLPDEMFGPVTQVAFSPDGQRVLTLAQDEPARLSLNLGGLLRPRYTDVPHQPIRLWDAVTAKPLLAPTGHTDRVKEARFSADGSRLLTISEGRDPNLRVEYLPLVGRTGQGTVPRDAMGRVWDTATGKELAAIHTGDARQSLCTVALSPDGTKVFFSDHTRQFLYDLGTNKEVWSTPLPLPFTFAEFSSDGRQILAFNDYSQSRELISDAQRLYHWDAATGKRGNSENENSHLTAAHFRPGTHQVLWALNTGQWRLGDLEQGKVLRARQAHTRAVQQVEFSSDGRRFVTLSEDHTTRVWDTESGEELLTLGDPRNPVRRAHFRPDGHELLTVTEDGAVHLVPMDPLPLAQSRRPRTLTAEERELFQIKNVP
jgi:WD40 repeat protein